MSNRKRWIRQSLLIAILLLGAAVRFVALESVPPGLSPDEATNGYDAYSIALTGRDQHGHLLPLTAASINDYRMPGFIYAAVPFVAALGLSVTSVRLAAAVMGWLTLPLAYRLGRRMFGFEAGAAAMALLALSPWHIPFSRMALEGTTVALVVTAAIAAVWRWHSDGHRWRWVWASGLLLGLSFYVYSIMKLFTPLLVVGLALIFRREVQKRPRQVAALIAIVGLLALPVALETLRAPEFMQARYNQIAVFKPERPLPEALGEALDNARVHLAPGFLFVHGDLDALHHPPGAGQLYWIQLPLLIAGCIGGLWHRPTRQATLVLLLWIGAALVPVTFTQITLSGSGHSHRTFAMVTAWQILSGAGLAVTLRARPRWRSALIALVTVAVLLQAGPYLHRYFFDYAGTVLARFDDGMPQAVRAMDALDDGYDVVVFTDQASWPYLHILFFTRYDPHQLQADLPVREPVLFAPVTRVGKYHVGDVQAAYERLDHGLFVMPAWMLPGVEPLAVTTYSTGEPAFKIVGK